MTPNGTDPVPLTHVSLFTGVGGIDLAAEWAGLPTPTAKANVLAPSMSKWPAYAAFQKWMRGRKLPCVWEQMMGLPTGWTDCEPSATPSSPSRSSQS